MKEIRKKREPYVGEIEGIIRLNRRGFGFVGDGDAAMRVEAEHLLGAFHGDTVKVKDGKVVEVIARRKSTFTGVVEEHPTGVFVKPDDRHFGALIRVTNTFTGADAGVKVIITVTDWDLGKPAGMVTEVIGKHGEHKTEMESILRDRDLVQGFSEAIETAAKHLYDAYNSNEEAKNRRDFRKARVFTIDPHDAKDFDDAISIEELKNDMYEIGVHIADVSHFISKGGILDKEAQARATSIYLVDRVIPMLPEALSNDLASLKPNVDRLTMSAVFTVDKKWHINDVWIGKTIINSKQRFTYESAEAVLNGGAHEFAKDVLTLWKFAEHRIQLRQGRGALDIDQDEVRAALDESGQVLGFTRKIRGKSNRLIEELMVLANEAVAEALSKKLPASVYRIHENPEPSRIIELKGFLEELGYKITTENGDPLRKSLRSVLSKSKGDKAKNVIAISIIRSMAKARYATENKGHFGLALKFYTHFTSPIRRYPDLIVHRLIGALNGLPLAYEKKELDRLSEHCSDREKIAADAERSSMRLKQIEFLRAKGDAVLDGIITNISDWGMFVEEKDSACEGYVSRDRLPKHFYFDGDHLKVIDKKQKRTLRIGDKVKIKIALVDEQRKEVDFILA